MAASEAGALGRPGVKIRFPLQSYLWITLEAEAILGIIGLCETGQLELVSSETLMFEMRRNPHPVRRDFGLEVLSKASSFVALNQEQIEKRAKAFGKIGIKALDALHVASAEAADVDYFCTCDDKLLNKAKTIGDLKMQVVSPVELIEAVE
jgi:predicted nucleic acid-binding protein